MARSFTAYYYNWQVFGELSESNVGPLIFETPFKLGRAGDYHRAQTQWINLNGNPGYIDIPNELHEDII